MPEIPECLNRRYRALDELMKELTSTMSIRSSSANCPIESTTDVGIKLMCDFWNILKEDPDCDLTEAVQERMAVNNKKSNVYGPERITCFTVDRSNSDDKKNDVLNKIKNLCCHSSEPESNSKCSASKSFSPSIGSDVSPLSKVLCNLKEAASLDKKCIERVNELIETEKQLQKQIQHLEQREKEGVQLLKQADCMWSCMEDAYKKKVADSLERQKDLTKQLKEVETSTTKWRKNKKDLEFQIENVNKCQQEISEKINQKTNDIKCIDMEIAEYKKRIENNKKDTEAAKKSLSNRKQTSDLKIANIAAELNRVQKQLSDEQKHKYNKEQEGSNYVREAREDLQKICRTLLQKKLENEDLKAEREALILELDMLKQTCDQCREKCENKNVSIYDEIKKVEKEIAEFKVKCIRCHQCTDTDDVRRFCTDCPRCLEERDCLYEDGHCNPDHSMDCVCMSIKQKFLDNVFDNMYTLLERQAKTSAGKTVAKIVLRSLKKSRNGKLNEEARKHLQDFILTTVKKNLNLTIVGGAVKTRCEMDPETYKQLMLCLKQVKVTQPPKEDKGTVAKKDPCPRWGGTSECNCPKGPKACICTKRAPLSPHDPTPCPPEDKNEKSEVVTCPHKEVASCGPDCALHGIPSCVETDVAAWRPDPCKGQSCPFTKNMRAAQCVLGLDSLSSLSTPMKLSPETRLPNFTVFADQVMCNCEKTPKKTCTCRKDTKKHPRDRIIEEVIGRYTDVTPIEKEKQPSKHEKINTAKTNKVISINKKISTIPRVPKHSFDSKNVTFGKQTEETAECSCPTLLKVSVSNDNGKLEDYLADITISPSGILTMELEQNIIKVIEETIKKDTNLSVYLKGIVTDAKHVKVEEQTECNENTCTLIWDHANDDLECEYSKEKEMLKHERNNTDKTSTKKTISANKESFTLPCVPTDIFDSKNVTFAERKAEYFCPTLLKVSVLNANGKLEDYFTDITISPSGILTMELDEKAIGFIDETMKKDLSVYLKGILTGNFVIDFACKDSVSSKDCQKLLINKTLSGILFLEVEKRLINASEMEKESSISIQISKIIQNNSNIIQDSSISFNKSKTPKHLYNKVQKSTPVDDYKLLLEEQYEQGNIYILVNEKVIKEMANPDTEKGSKNFNDEIKNSQYIIGTVENPANKAVATTCNSKREDNSCDFSKCVCKELRRVCLQNDLTANCSFDVMCVCETNP
ncbi:uncharacterized protein ACR2FA_008911 [Aphomia sociella]